MSQTLNAAIALAGIDIGKNSFHIVDRGPVISSAMVAAIGAGDVFNKGRDFVACWRACQSGSQPGTIPITVPGALP